MTGPGSRVLVVDDDADIRDLLTSTLSFSGFEVETSGDAVSALHVLERRPPDVVVVDVMMPGLDGFELVDLLRRRGDRVPVLFLTARDAVADRVQGLRLGADDYVTKPFSVIEVVARLEALVRRSRADPDEPDDLLLVCGDLEVDVARHVVRRAGLVVSLSATEFRLLTYLLTNRDKVVSKGQILENVWHFDFRGDTNVVERFISNLRRKVDDTDQQLIHTVRGFGYRISAAGD